MFLDRIFKPSKAYVETQRNRAAVHCLKELKFKPDRIRRALLELNGIRIRKLANGAFSPSLVYGTIRGDRKHRPIMEQVATELEIPVQELFPDAERRRVKNEKSAQAANGPIRSAT